MALIDNDLIDKETAENTLKGLTEQRAIIQIASVITEKSQARETFKKSAMDIIDIL